MSRARFFVPFLAAIALLALFFKLPDTPNLFGMFGCKSCTSIDPFLPLLGSSYFAFLFALSLLFPTFPSPMIARGGVIWAILLFVSLTWIDYPGFCIACLIGHACNILIWVIWLACPSLENKPGFFNEREKLYLTVLVPICVVALFSSLNLTFMAYGFKIKGEVSSLQLGDVMPSFTVKTAEGRLIARNAQPSTHEGGYVINFVSPDCPHCKDQLVVINTVAANFSKESVRFINVSPHLPPELIQRSPDAEWVEDKDHDLLKLFKVSAYPTIFVIGPDFKIAQIIPGVPDQLKTILLTTLVKLDGQNN